MKKQRQYEYQVNHFLLKRQVKNGGSAALVPRAKHSACIVANKPVATKQL